MPHLQPPTIDSQAARRWRHLPASESPWLHEEVARRMQERLDWIKQQPASWVHWEPVRGGWQAHGLLRQRYPKAVCTILESSVAGAAQARLALRLPWWQPQRWLRAPTPVVTQIDLPAQMVWSNMALHMVADPRGLMAQWHQALDVDGFLMFSCLGPDTLKELQTLYRALQWPAPAHDFTDMHDWGDMLVSAGFAEPVMDMERITLTFETPERLLQELRGLGRNLSVGRFAGLRGRRWHQHLLQALARQPLQLTFEVIYGHAFRPPARLTVGTHSEISLDDMRATLARGRGMPHQQSRAHAQIGKGNPR
ncbi:biotin synthase [Rhodoferax sp.]|uniref:biotin synthase n=1 Tax=Rhodoferax sp. TaxID=50421 RepID=UPI002622264D|nr:biotin synthase [Rhodoferax sp.]MDD2924409.1 biotin synthase [Rhodoferax sp.]